jgi:D-alanyl-D-alanine carboxypeptidase (penicillin-binding protein 5/6)
MKKLRIFPLLLIISLVFALAAPAAQALSGPDLTAQAVILVDLDTGMILYEKQSKDQRSPASLVKVMTVLLALEAVDRGEVTLDDVVTAGLDCQQGMGDDSSSVYIVAGEQMTLRDLLYCAAVASGNDACNVIAAYIGGSISSFVELMNNRAKALGCSEKTHFVDPNGLSSEDTSCALDLYKITWEALKHPDFVTITDTVSYRIPATNINDERTLNNSNALITADGIYGPGYLYEGAHGVKTGYTRAAGYCLISTAERDGIRLLGIVMGCDGPYLSDTETRYNFVDSAKLYDWAFENFVPRVVLSTDEKVTRFPVSLGQGDGEVEVRPQQDVALLLPVDAPPGQEDVRFVSYPEKLTAPIYAGDVLGEAQIYYSGNENPIKIVKLVAAGNVELARVDYIKEQGQNALKQPWVRTVLIVMAVLALAYLALVIRYRILRRKHLKQRKQAERRRQELARQRQQAAQSQSDTPFERDLF